LAKVVKPPALKPSILEQLLEAVSYNRTIERVPIRAREF
jgi:hypothetical protein